MVHMARVGAGVAGWHGPLANRPTSVVQTFVCAPPMEPLALGPATPTSAVGSVCGISIEVSISPLCA